MIASSYIISTSLSNTPHFAYVLLNKVFLNLGLPFLLFKFVRKVDDILFFVKVIKIFVFFLFPYVLLEMFLGRSIIIDFINANNEVDMNLDEMVRNGIKRVQGTFLHCLTLGYFCIVLLSFLWLFVLRRKNNYISNKEFIIIAILLSILVILSGTRSAMVVLFGFGLYMFAASNNKIRIFVFSSILFLFAYFIFYDKLNNYFSQIIYSFVGLYDSSYSDGSSFDLRAEQISIALYYFSSHMIWGSGYGTTYDLVTVIETNMLGAESVWFNLMIDEGAVGCISYLFCYYEAFKAIKKNLIPAIIFLSAILFMNTVTTLPGIDLSFILGFVVVIKRMQIIDLESKNVITSNCELKYGKQYSRGVSC